MNKIVQINGYCESGSTGKICVSISEKLTDKGIENYILYTQGKSKYSLSVKYGGEFIYTKFQSLKAKLFGNNGDNCHIETVRLVKILNKIKPTHVHLHNLHAQNINLKMLYAYLARNNIKVIWTFHDCWGFTGYCMHFENIHCTKWMHGCRECPQRKIYSWFLDRSKKIYEIKKRYSELNLTIITPSEWLENHVRNSFYKKNRIITINNGINHDIFKRVNSKFREKNNLLDKYIVLAVADRWNAKKGLDIIIELSQKLDEKYKIVIVGTNPKIEKHLPSNIYTISKTENQKKLAEIYSSADVFINPTREDTFPTVNIEALSCGLPVITNDVCGCREIVNKKSGYVITNNNIEQYLECIKKVCEMQLITIDDCIRQGGKFDQKKLYDEYIKVYFDS